MKLNGIVGKGSGRLGMSVFTVRGGVQIVRQYTPNVANPNTNAQKEQRAKFKLMTQLAAITSNGLLFPKVGNVSRRNAFMAANMDAVTWAPGTGGGSAIVSLDNVKLGNGYAPITAVRIDMAEQNEVMIELQSSGWDGIAYATVDFLDNNNVVGFSAVENVTGIRVPVIGARMSRTRIIVAAWRFRDGAARAKYNEIMAGNTSQGQSNITVSVRDLATSGDIEVSQTVVATVAE